MLPLQQLVDDFGNALLAIDASGIPHKSFKPGVGPYGEPQLAKGIIDYLRKIPAYHAAQTKRTPDIHIPNEWALELKIARPFGDNDKEAENWSVNLLHPYEGNVSVIGDCLKLARFTGPERRAVIVIGYEHTPPKISLAPLFDAFEVICEKVMKIRLGPRTQIIKTDLCHPVHQQFIVAAWEVLVASPSRF
jgi:hypothetical protein